MNQRRDDGYRAVRAVIYRDIARVVVIMSLIIVLVWIGSSPAQEWQVKALGVPAGSTALASTVPLCRDGDSFAPAWSSGAGVIVAELVVTTRWATYGNQQFPSGKYPMVGPAIVTSSIHIIDPTVSLKDVETYVNADPDLARSRQRGATEYFGPPPTPPALGWFLWKYGRFGFVCVLGVFAFVLWLLRPRFLRMLRRSRSGHCWKCNYDLDNTLPVCPECGSKAWTSSFDIFRRVPLRDSPTA